MKKSELTLEREARQRTALKEQAKPYARFVEYVLFGTGSIITSTIAAYAVFKYLSLSGWQLWVACIAIAITLTPAVVATGRYIIQGALNEARR